MKKILLLAASVATILTAQAEGNFYYSTNCAEARGVSPSGNYAIFTHPDNAVPYLWSRENPEEFTPLLGNNLEGLKFDAYDVSDNGTVVGAVQFTDAQTHRVYWHPCLYKDGQFTYLPCDFDVFDPNTNTALVGNNCKAIRISANEKIIGGTVPARPGSEDCAYPAYPAVWEYDEEANEWVFHLFNNVGNMPDHQGFQTTCMYSDGTYEGTILGGYLFCGAGGMIPALAQTGHLMYHEWLVNRIVPTETVWGMQYWEYYFINGFADGWNGDFWTGGYFGCDIAGHFYGSDSNVVLAEGEELPYDGRVNINSGSLIYDAMTGERTYTSGQTGFTCGVDGKYIFMQNGNVLFEGETYDVATLFGIDTKGISPDGYTGTNNEGDVIIGQYNQANPASGEMDPFPVVITLDRPLVSVEQVAEQIDQPDVRVQGNVISVEGAEQVAIYDMQSRLISTAAQSTVAPGIYVVKADQAATKVIVK